jgi:glycosyltransferase involved in cell wall biosynthesis
MKILQVSNFLAPVHGGSAEVPYQLSKALSGRGHEVTIFTSNLKLDSALPMPGINLTTFNTPVQLAGFTITPGMIEKVKKDICNYDIIHLHNYRTFQNIIAHRYAVKNGVPYVLQAHGSLATYFQKGFSKRLFDIIWGSKILQDAQKVFAVTEIEAAQYRSLGVSAGKIEIVPHGIDLAEYNSAIPKGVFKKQFQIGENQKVALFLGRIHQMKGLDILVKAFAGLRRNRKDTVLVIAGPDGGYQKALKKLVDEMGIGESVVFTGPLYGKDKLQAYTDADVYVLPSSYEIFGITILEAWACGKPVIVTDRCGLADVVKDKAGLVVPYEPETLQTALSRLIDDDALMAEFSRQGRKLVEERYNWRQVALRVESIYHVVGKKTTQ